MGVPVSFVCREISSYNIGDVSIDSVWELTRHLKNFNILVSNELVETGYEQSHESALCEKEDVKSDGQLVAENLAKQLYKFNCRVLCSKDSEDDYMKQTVPYLVDPSHDSTVKRKQLISTLNTVAKKLEFNGGLVCSNQHRFKAGDIVRYTGESSYNREIKQGDTVLVIPDGRSTSKYVKESVKGINVSDINRVQSHYRFDIHMPSEPQKHPRKFTPITPSSICTIENEADFEM